MEKILRWSFNDSVAEQFDDIVKKNIQSYEVILNKCIEVIDLSLNKSSLIVDIGCATGNTLVLLDQHGYTNIVGVDNSTSMTKKVSERFNIIISDTYPKYVKADCVLLNWTLHFIKDKKKYLKTVFKNTPKKSILIVTDKVVSSETSKRLYYKFKKENGMTDEEISIKERQLKGVMKTRPTEWYLKTLKSVGYSSVDIIHSDYCFNTFLAIKNQ